MTLKRIFELVYVLIYKEWIVKYKRTILGYFWSILYPLFLTVILYFIFSHIVGIHIPNYFSYLLIGLFVWHWFSNSIMINTGIFYANYSLIKKVNFPRFTLPLAISIIEMIHFLISLPLILMALKIDGLYLFKISWILYIPLLLLLELILIFSLSLIFGMFNVLFRDIERLVSMLLLILFYLTPIFYSEKMIPDQFKIFFYLNPMFYIVNLWREVLIQGNLNIKYCIISVVYISFLLLIAIIFYKKINPKIPEIL